MHDLVPTSPGEKDHLGHRHSFSFHVEHHDSFFHTGVQHDVHGCSPFFSHNFPSVWGLMISVVNDGVVQGDGREGVAAADGGWTSAIFMGKNRGKKALDTCPCRFLKREWEVSRFGDKTSKLRRTFRKENAFLWSTRLVKPPNGKHLCTYSVKLG